MRPPVSRKRKPGMRRLVFARDGGICSRCGCDTEKLRRVATLAADMIDRAHPRDTAESILDTLGFTRGLSATPNRHLWEADHIKPFASGGECSLDNLRTLCVPCHQGRGAHV